jgi:hypothetical protein
MKQLMLVLAGVSALAACSSGREQRAPSSDRMAQQPDLTLPASPSRQDTSVTLSSRTERPTSAEDQQVKESPRSTRAKPSITRSRAGRKTSSAQRQRADTGVRGYAPSASRDTSGATDSLNRNSTTVASASATGTRGTPNAAAALPGDTVTPTETSVDTISPPPTSQAHQPDTAAPRDTTAPRPDTTAPRVDTAATRPDSGARRDTVAGGRDSVPASPDTVASANADTVASSAPVEAAVAARNTAARTLPVGTEIHAALDDSITSRHDTVGQQVAGHVMGNVIGPDGRTLIAAGAPVRLTITQIRPSRSKSSQGRLVLLVEGISLAGQFRPVKADIRAVPRELRGRGVTGSEAAKVGGGAAAGAVIGGVVGKTKGAVIGGVAGAAAGAVVASQTATRDVVVKAKTPVVLVLTAPWVAP